MFVRGTFVIDALLGFALLALPFGAALLIFHHVLAQLAIGAKQPSIGNYKVGLLVFFVWHKLAFRYSLFAFRVKNRRGRATQQRWRFAHRFALPCLELRSRDARTRAPTFAHRWEMEHGPSWLFRPHSCRRRALWFP